MAHNHTRILVVDDDPVTRMTLRDALTNEGYVVELEAEGASALRLVQRLPPDVLLADVHMPEMDGIELCRKVHEIHPDLPVILITGLEDMSSVVRALRAGAEDYLTKPLDFAAMLLGIERVIQRRAAKVEGEQLRARSGALYQQMESAVQAHQDVLSIVSHDLRNPLGVITMAAQRLRDLPPRGEAGRDTKGIAAMILRGTARMERLIADLLDESRIRSGHLSLECEGHSLSQLLEDVCELRPLAQNKRILIDIVAPEWDGQVHCDRLRVGQALGNLVANAIKFSPEGSTVTVSAGANNGRVTFTVRDAAGGIAPEAVASVFDQFWQAKQGRRSGVGLGLYIVKGIAEAHGGEIRVMSHLGVGSTFHLEIPERATELRAPMSWQDEAASNQWIPDGELSRANRPPPRCSDN
jgi:signal transduction histidine kinase